MDAAGGGLEDCRVCCSCCQVSEISRLGSDKGDLGRTDFFN